MFVHNNNNIIFLWQYNNKLPSADTHINVMIRCEDDISHIMNFID